MVFLLSTKKTEFDTARIHFQKAIDLNSNNHAFHASMADLLCNKKSKYEESLEYSLTAFLLNKTDGDYAYLIGEAYYHLKQWILCHEYYKISLESNTTSLRYGYDKKTAVKRINIIESKIQPFFNDIIMKIYKLYYI